MAARLVSLRCGTEARVVAICEPRSFRPPGGARQGRRQQQHLAAPPSVPLCTPSLHRPQRQRCCALRQCLASSSSSLDEPPALSNDEPLSSSEQPSTSSSSGGGSSRRRDQLRVPVPPHLHGKAPRKHWNATALAFLGDGVWELYARRRFFYPPSRKDSYTSQVIDHVRAETQEKLHDQLLGSGFLTDAERDVLRWGRNATGVTPKRLSDTGLKRETYRAATAIECLAGYLYLSDPERLHDMMCQLGLGDAPPEGSGASSSYESSSVDGDS